MLENYRAVTRYSMFIEKCAYVNFWSIRPISQEKKGNEKKRNGEKYEWMYLLIVIITFHSKLYVYFFSKV